ncbi:DUF4058 family protein [Nostoc sp. WHI]|uniref:DUF4058 family protein n=1 Tax=Nostoc sp. WHI TaxID=2650611 RepID=UPI0018C4FFB5|nr:DUF4058 family protein [Nostoc sp. WHI]MBG1269601.1 DUF4058 family protein [Nostoc sp. WHI]
MPSPFPGMNPYLEDPALWQKVHKRLIVAIADSLSPLLRPKYIVDIEERVYQTSGEDALLVGIPDVAVQRQKSVINSETANVAIVSPPVEAMTVTVPMLETVRESYLEVREVATREVVTVIEVLSPKNKRPGEGRRVYERKRQRVLGSFTNLVEIDLLRDGKPMLVFGDGTQNDYRILVCRGKNLPQADLYAFNLQDVIPSFPLPLRTGDSEPLVDLQSLLAGIYDRASYDLVINYSQEPALQLSEQNAVWVDALLRDKGLR